MRNGSRSVGGKCYGEMKEAESETGKGESEASDEGCVTGSA